MSEFGQKIRELRVNDVESLLPQLLAEAQPAVLRGIASAWPLVQAGRDPAGDADGYLLGYYNGAQVTAFYGEPGAGGHIFYTDELAEMNFRQQKTGLDRVLDDIRAAANEDPPPTVYMGSMALDYCLPGLREDNSLALGDLEATVRIWIGNRTTVAAHYDVMDNIACVCAGRRRFTLFPPEQFANLYVGPLDFTPAGQAVSLVDIDEPDLERFPRFEEAMQHALRAELEPGDGIFIPAMWWHHVEGLDAFNILVNHWWRDVPSYMGAPGDALLHAILSLRDLPENQRKTWQDMFAHYVFDYSEDKVAHIPAARRGVLGPLDDELARRLRTLLRNRLNR